MSLSEEDMKRIEKENESLFKAFKGMDWELSEDPETRELTLMAMAQMDDYSRVTLEVSARAYSKQSTMWTEEVATWENEMDPLERRHVREEFIASCMTKMVTEEFLLDAKKRWTNADFSCVSETYLVIGDVYAKRRGDKLPLKPETDVSTIHSTIGRDSVTYDEWAKMIREKNIVAVRPKINGERFVVVQQGDQKKLKGFCEIEVPVAFRPMVVEYYAGKFYSLFPYFSKSQTYSVIWDGKPVNVIFHPHPFLSPYDFYNRREEFASHKYDGLMIWTGTHELRAKWNPTVDIVHDGQVWEVSLSKELVLERPRYGKGTVSSQTAESRIRSQIRGKFLLTHFKDLPEERDPIVRAVEEAADRQVALTHCAGSKCLFFDKTMEMVMIREPNKRLDLIGGMIEPKESPIDAMVRETLEETGLRMSPESFLYVGQSKDISDTTEWTSHMFIAVAPEAMYGKQNLERYSLNDIGNWIRSSEGRPRQVWLSRILEHVRMLFPTYYDLWAAAAMVWDRYIPIMRMIMSPTAMQYIKPFYLTKLMKLKRQYEISDSPSSLYDWLTKQHYWVDEKILQELTNKTSGHMLPYPTGDPGKIKIFLRHLFDENKPLTRKAFDLKMRLKAEPATSKERDLKVGYYLKHGFLTLQGDKLVLSC